jgi:hypothetical protein
LSWEKLLDDLGLNWRYVSSAEVEKGAILDPVSGLKTLVLPQTIALSSREVDVLKQFAGGGGKLVADALCGRFDEHGSARKQPPLDELFGVDTAAEPFFPVPMHPLESVKNATGPVDKRLADLAPVFSDAPKLAGGATGTALEYRHSPVLVSCAAGAYLNLDLTDYLRWRLHPEQPCAKATVELLAETAFPWRTEDGLVDWAASKLPYGTQLIWLRAGEGRILALRRNPQERLHELGGETDGNGAFEKAEPFTLALRTPVWVSPVLPPEQKSANGLVQKIEGVLDPVQPAIFVLLAGKPSMPNVKVAGEAKLGKTLELKLACGGPGLRIFALKVIGPDGIERAHYAQAQPAAGGSLSFFVPFALNDPPGEWKLLVREVMTGWREEVRIKN